MSYTVGDLTVDFQNSRCYIGREEARLTRLEYRIVELLARTPGRALTHDYIIASVWGPYAPSNNSLILRVNIADIRRRSRKTTTRRAISWRKSALATAWQMQKACLAPKKAEKAKLLP